MRKPGAEPARELWGLRLTDGDQQIRQAAKPRRCRRLMQGGERDQRGTIIQASHGMAGHDGRGDDGGCGEKQVGVAGGARRSGQDDDSKGRRDANRTSENKIRAKDVAKRHVGGLSKDD